MDRTRATGRARRLRYEADGRLFDLDERRFVGLAELAGDVRAGRPFRAQRQGTGAECTNQVLVEVLLSVPASRSRQAGAPGLLGSAARLLRAPDDAEPPPDDRSGRTPSPRTRRRP
ncbi:hypothetical protein [Actinomadura algeriensis]|uniref:PHA accumulation regulator DNA-binding N-terminal domain-containing protein n=1 Tax=Actinomadura algeriensis TaxID=1679523 RepID=A0ABR9K3Q7_9ACTN|nr:hypothetical protein [Actinomadura algeriensis]MBE1537486.1 hypothetical protein [Actinomadura algeriensis]